MGMTKRHWLLCSADNFMAAREYVRAFFNNSTLLCYDAVEVVESGSCSADDGRFWRQLEEGIAANRRVLSGFLSDLRAEGCREISGLASLPMGYSSKVLHIIAHLLDGFIGIDSVCYNLVEDSHWLSDSLRAAIMKKPRRYWLIQVEASFTSAESASIIHSSKK